MSLNLKHLKEKIENLKTSTLSSLELGALSFFGLLLIGQTTRILVEKVPYVFPENFVQAISKFPAGIPTIIIGLFAVGVIIIYLMLFLAIIKLILRLVFFISNLFKSNK